MHSTRSRRHFLRTSAADPNGKLRVLPIRVVGTNGYMERTQVF